MNFPLFILYKVGPGSVCYIERTGDRERERQTDRQTETDSTTYRQTETEGGVVWGK